MQTHSALRRSNRLAPIDSSPPPNDRKHPQDDEPEPNPMAPKKPKKGSGKGKSKSNKRQPPTVNSPAPRSAVNTEFERYGNVSTPTRSDRFVSQPPQSINPASMQGFTANTSTRFNHNLDFTTNQPLIARSHPSPVFTNNHSPGLSTARQIIPPVHYNDASHQLGNSAARLASSPVHLIDIPGRHGLTPVHQTISPIRAVNTPGHLNLNAAHSLPPSVRFIDTPRHPGPAPHQGPSPVHIVETPGRPIPIATHQIPPVHAVNHPGLTTTHTLPPPVRAVNTSDRSQLSYPVHRSHHIGPPSSHVPDLPLPAADRFLDPSPMRITPPNLAQRSGVTALNPQHSQEAEIIDVDELGEDDSSNPSDGEDEESPDDTIEYLAASEQSSASGVKFSPTIVDVLQKHWKTNGRPTLKVGPRPKRVRPEPSPDSRHFYTGPWSKVLDLARNLLIGRVILDYAFPNATDLAADSMECLTDAVATVRARPSNRLDDHFLEEHRESMAKLISKHPTTYRGILRDHIRSLIKDEVTKAIEDAPPIILSDANGRSLEVTEEKDTIVREFIRKKLCGKRFLDGPWATLMSGRTGGNSLNSPMLRAAVIKIYDYPLSQDALRASPSEEILNKQPIVPGDPGYYAHWSKVPPPRLVALAGTILQVCYEEWRSGTHAPINLHGTTFFSEYDGMFDLIYSEWSHQLRRDAIRKRFASWARMSTIH